LNFTLENGLGSDIVIPSWPIATFVAGTPGSVTITGDVTALLISGRICDIRDPAHVGPNDNWNASRPYVINTSTFALGVTTLAFQATATYYRVGGISVDVAGDSSLTSSLLQCNVSGKYLIQARGSLFGGDMGMMRLVNVSGFTYNTYGQVSGAGGTVWTAGMGNYWNTVPGIVTWDRVVDLVAGQYYEMQQWSATNSASETGLGYTGPTDPEAKDHCEVSIQRWQ
jgi:hypothetical protein